MIFRKVVAIGLAAMTLSLASACREDEEVSDTKEAQPGDQLGTTCYSYPRLTDKNSGSSSNLCLQPGKIFYGGFVQMPFAKGATVQKCKDMNALDNGHRAGPGKSCWKECASVTYCIPYTQE